ncbi:hypothetical protein Tco_0331186, partial [Tanacetum coccineum]
NPENRNGNNTRKVVPVETPANTLVVTDGKGYDWSCQADEGPTDFALMAHLSSGSSSSSSSNSEVQNCSNECLESYKTLQKQYDQQHEALNKANIEIIACQLGLESLEARIVVHQKNEAVFEEDIAFLKYDVKTGIGFDSQMNENELHDSHQNKSEVFKSAFNSSMNECEEDNDQVNDRYKAGVGYHVIPPPYTRNYIPPIPDLSFAGLDESVFRTIVKKSTTSVPKIESSTSKSSKDVVEGPKTISPSAPINEEWESDSDDDCVFRPSAVQTKPKFVKINFVKSDENVKLVNKENTPRKETGEWF